MNTTQFRIVAKPFGYPMYAAPVGAGWTDRKEEAYLYDHRDPQTTKITYWRAHLAINGLDASSVTAEPA